VPLFFLSAGGRWTRLCEPSPSTARHRARVHRWPALHRVLRCSRHCGGAGTRAALTSLTSLSGISSVLARMRLIACIDEPDGARKILEHRGLRAEPLPNQPAVQCASACSGRSAFGSSRAVVHNGPLLFCRVVIVAPAGDSWALLCHERRPLCLQIPRRRRTRRRRPHRRALPRRRQIGRRRHGRRLPRRQRRRLGPSFPRDGAHPRHPRRQARGQGPTALAPRRHHLARRLRGPRRSSYESPMQLRRRE
jgi:hypothetical protein